MLELAGYYDGANVRFLDGAVGGLRKNQRLKIIALNDFVEENTPNARLSEENPDREKARRAFGRLLSHARPGIGSGDYKGDLAEMLEKRYAAFD